MAQHFFRDPDTDGVIALVSSHRRRATELGYVEISRSAAKAECPELFAGEIAREKAEAGR